MLFSDQTEAERLFNSFLTKNNIPTSQIKVSQALSVDRPKETLGAEYEQEVFNIYKKRYCQLLCPRVLVISTR